jgi:hypothetical protein
MNLVVKKKPIEGARLASFVVDATTLTGTVQQEEVY